MRKVTMLGAALLAAAAFTAAGCGSSSDSPKDQVNKIVNDGAKNPETVCDHISKSLLEKFGGKDKCVEAAKADPSNADPNAKILSTTINGDNATVKIQGNQGEQTISLTKEDGKWVVVSS